MTLTADLAAYRAAQTAERGAVVAVRTLATANRLAERAEALADALDELADVFGDGMTATHVGPGFTCTEAERIADVLRLAGHTAAAERWLNGHAEQNEKDGDTDPEDFHHGRYVRGQVIDRYTSLLRDAADAGRITGEELRYRWEAAERRLANVARYADGRAALDDGAGMTEPEHTCGGTPSRTCGRCVATALTDGTLATLPD